MIVDKQKNIHIYEKIIPQIKEFIPVLEQAKDMEVGRSEEHTSELQSH